MIDRFVAALRETKLELDWRDIADVLWLADVRARDATSESGESPADGEPAPAEPTAKPRKAGGPATSDAADASPVPAKPAELQAELQEVTPVRPADWRLTERGDADNSGGAALEAAAPTSYALPGGMEIGRALRPMKQQRRTPRRKVFDPEATIDRFCDTGVLVPVLRAGSERRFDVAIVADTSATMAVWDDTVAALADLLERHGAFRGVTRWALAQRDGAIEVLSPSGLAHRPHELLDLAGRRLVLVVTDAVDALWARAPVWEALRAWGEYGPVALVQVLPPRSWAQTRLGEADAAVAASRPGQPNSQLEVVPPWWWLEDEPPDHAVPVVGLDEASLSSWARMVMGAPGVSVPGVLAVPGDGIDGGASGQADLPGEVDLDQLGNVLRSTVSAQAYRLAVLLSAVEVSLPIARIVMHELMPHARLAHLAELIAAGVLKAARLPAPGVASAAVGAGAPLPTAAPGSRADRSQIALTFSPGLRELLQRSLTVTMTLQVWRAVAPYLEATHGLRRFSLLLQPPHAELDAAAGTDELREGLQAITADLADRLGLVPSPAADWPPSSERPAVEAADGPVNAPTAANASILAPAPPVQAHAADEFFARPMHMFHITGFPQQPGVLVRRASAPPDARLDVWPTDPADDRPIAGPGAEGVLFSTPDFSLANSGSRTLHAPKRSWKITLGRGGRGANHLAGMARVSLKSMYNDPSQMREALALHLFRQAGVPAARHTYAKLAFDETYYGLFSITEEIDKRFLKDHFGGNDHGNLYKAYCGDVGCATLEYRTGADGDDSGRQYYGAAADDRTYRLMTNKDDHDAGTYDDLATFIRTINGTGLPLGDKRFDTDAFRESVENVMNVRAFLRWASVNLLLGAWDNYFATPSNYYLYNSGHLGAADDFMRSPYFTFIPWDYHNCLGIDYFGTKWQYTDILDWPGNTGKYWRDRATSRLPLVQNILRSHDFCQYYLDYLEYVLDTAFTPDLMAQRMGLNGDGLWDRVHQAAYLESATPYGQPFTGRQFTNDEVYQSGFQQRELRHGQEEIEGIMQYTRMRYDGARAQLAQLRTVYPRGDRGADFPQTMEGLPDDHE